MGKERPESHRAEAARAPADTEAGTSPAAILPFTRPAA